MTMMVDGSVGGAGSGVAGGTRERVGGVATERLEAEICDLAARLAVATCAWLDLIGEYDMRRAWADWECRSMAHWLVGHVGESLVTAREHVRVAAALRRFALLHHEFACGRLSYARVRAVTRVMTDTSEADLVSMARATTASQLERFVRGVQRATLAGDLMGGRRQWERRTLHVVRNEDGGFDIRGRVPADVGVLLERLLRERIDRVRAACPTDTTDIDKRRADALAELLRDAAALPPDTGHDAAESQATPDDAAASQATPDDAAASSPMSTTADTATDATSDAAKSSTTTDDGPSRDSAESSTAPAPATKRERLRPLVVVHRYPDGDELDTTACHPTIADVLACDADTVELAHDRHGNPLSYGRRRRTPTTVQRRTVLARDQTCQMPGCASRRNLQLHHIQWWSHGGPTDHTNLYAFCACHHPEIHHGGWIITINPDRTLRFERPATPDHRHLTSHQPGLDTTNNEHDLEHVIEHLETTYGLPLTDTETIQCGNGQPIRPTGWGPFDLELAVWAYCNNETTRNRQRDAAESHREADS